MTPRASSAETESSAHSALRLLAREIEGLDELRDVHARVGELRVQYRRVDAAALAARESARAAAVAATDRTVRSAWLAVAARISTVRQLQLMRQRDDLGVLPPAAVRIGTRAASAPAQAGMVLEAASHARTQLPRPRYGVDLEAVVAQARRRDALTDPRTARELAAAG